MLGVAGRWGIGRQGAAVIGLGIGTASGQVGFEGAAVRVVAGW